MKKKIIVSSQYMHALGLCVHHGIEVDMLDTETLKKYKAEIMKDGLVEWVSTHLDLHRGLCVGLIYGGDLIAGAVMELRLTPHTVCSWDLKDIDSVVDYVSNASKRPWIL